MSVFSYFDRRDDDDLRMPKGEDSCGIRWEGPVLSGKIGVKLALRRAETYKSVNEYDAVTRAHCRMTE